jgi:hypothetical protein
MGVAEGDGVLDELAGALGTKLGATVEAGLEPLEQAPASNAATAASDQIRREVSDILTVTPRSKR